MTAEMIPNMVCTQFLKSIHVTYHEILLSDKLLYAWK